MSSPLLWFGQKAKLLKSILQIPGSTSGSIDIGAGATPATYSLTLPGAQGAASTVLTNDGAGVLSWAPSGSSPTATSFTLANNQAASSNVTGFLVNSAVNTGFSAECSVRRKSTNTIVGGNTGVINSTFQTNATAAGITGYVLDSAIQSNGSVILVGSFTAYAGVAVNNICRIDADGVLDTAFSAAMGTGPDNIVHCVHIQADGKIVVGGDFDNFDGLFFKKLARLTTAGALEPGFMNTNGGFNFLVTSISSLSATGNSNLIIGGGFTSFTDETSTTNTFNRIIGLTVAGKLLAPGVVFAPSGTGFNSGTVRSIAVDLATDDVYMVGSFSDYDGNTREGVAKTDKTGSIQTGFVGLGNSTTVGVGDKCALQSDGKLVVAGQIYQDVLATDAVGVWRFNTSGAYDSTFNNTLTPFTTGLEAYSLGIQSDGKILVGGGFSVFGLSNIFRLNSDGTQDATFTGNATPGATGTQINSISIGTDSVAYVGGTAITDYAASPISDNVFMLGMVGSVVVTSSYVQFTIRGVYRPVELDWDLGLGTGVGVATGVDFTMTALGQLQYTSSNYAGAVDLSQMRFLVTGL